MLNIILVKFNPQFGNNVDKDFEEKYHVSFADYEVYAVLTAFPGKYAPAVQDQGFWSKHALLEKTTNIEKTHIEILDFEADSHGDHETEYWINVKITGKIGGKSFTIGKGDEDLYIHGASQFYHLDELIDRLEELSYSTGIMKKYNPDEYEKVLKLILEKMKAESKWREKLESLMENCNQTAQEMQDSWDESY